MALAGGLLLLTFSLSRFCCAGSRLSCGRRLASVALRILPLSPLSLRPCRLSRRSLGLLPELLRLSFPCSSSCRSPILSSLALCLAPGGGLGRASGPSGLACSSLGLKPLPSLSGSLLLPRCFRPLLLRITLSCFPSRSSSCCRLSRFALSSPSLSLFALNSGAFGLAPTATSGLRALVRRRRTGGAVGVGGSAALSIVQREGLELCASGTRRRQLPASAGASRRGGRTGRCGESGVQPLRSPLVARTETLRGSSEGCRFRRRPLRECTLNSFGVHGRELLASGGLRPAILHPGGNERRMRLRKTWSS